VSHFPPKPEEPFFKDFAIFAVRFFSANLEKPKVFKASKV
jgi:hypothetical protein